MTHGSKDTKDEVMPALAYFTFSPKNYEDKSESRSKSFKFSREWIS